MNTPIQPDSEPDVHVCFSDLDNIQVHSNFLEPVLMNGWIDHFIYQFSSNLAVHLGRRVNIVRSGHFETDPNKLPKLMVVVASESFKNSKSLQKELDSFVHRSGESLIIGSGSSRRLIFVTKGSIEFDGSNITFEKLFKESRAIDFWHENPENPSLIVAWETNSSQFRRACEELAQYAKAAIRKIEQSNLQSLSKGLRKLPGDLNEEISVAERPKIFLSYATSDVREYTNRLRDELDCVGEVLPEPNLTLPFDTTYKRKTQELINRCQISIHPIGGASPPCPEDSEDQSVVSIQLDCARLVGKSNDMFRRIIWIPASFSKSWNPREGHKNLIEEISKSKDVVTCELEELKSIVDQHLSSSAKRMTTRHVEKEAVYAVYEQRDAQEAKPCVENYLGDCAILHPYLEGTTEENRQSHEDALRLCQEVCMFWGKVALPWIYSTLIDVQKAPGFGRTQPFDSATVFIGAPQSTVQKLEFNQFVSKVFPNIRINVIHV